MTQRLCPVLLTAVVVAASATGAAQDPTPSARWLELLESFSAAGIVRHADISYDAIQGVDPARLSLDVYTRQDLERAPVLLFIHGGGWRRGDKVALSFLKALSHKSDDTVMAWRSTRAQHRIAMLGSITRTAGFPSGKARAEHHQ
jgi:acetyl esterase/lipase